MALLRILQYPDSALKQRARPVENIDGQVAELIENMAETMYAAPGVGLAATQVGIDRRVIASSIPRSPSARARSYGKKAASPSPS